MLLQRFYNPVFTDRNQWPAHTAFNDLIRQFDQSFNQIEQGISSLPIKIVETHNSYKLVTYVPLVDPKSIELNIRDRQLHIKVIRPDIEKTDDEQLLLNELPAGTFERWIQFEKDISAEASASLKEGVLTLVIPKKQVQQSVPIQVETAN